jgi:hypothetical protein
LRTSKEKEFMANAINDEKIDIKRGDLESNG